MIIEIVGENVRGEKHIQEAIEKEKVRQKTKARESKTVRKTE